MFGSGIDSAGCLLDAAEKCGIVDRKGSWYSKGDLRFAQGKAQGAEFLRSNKKFADEIAAEVREMLLKKALQLKESSSLNIDFESMIADNAEKYDDEVMNEDSA